MTERDQPEQETTDPADLFATEDDAPTNPTDKQERVGDAVIEGLANAEEIEAQCRRWRQRK